MQSRLVAAVAVAAVVGAGATGCSRSDKASTLPTPAPSSSVATTPAPTYPATPDGAADFARHYYALINQAFQTGRTEELRTLSLPSCESCQRLADSAEALYRNGGHL